MKLQLRIRLCTPRVKNCLTSKTEPTFVYRDQKCLLVEIDHERKGTPIWDIRML